MAQVKPADLDALMAAPFGNGRTVLEEQQEMVLVIGENIKVRRFAFFTEGVSVPYVHAGGKIGVLVVLDTDLPAEKVETVGKDVAMQIAALNPRFWDKSEVDQATLDEEKKILMVQMENDPKMASKPEKVREGIITGKLGKFYKENCLLQQEFVKDNSMDVAKYIASAARSWRHHHLQDCRPLREGRGHREEAGELRRGDRQAAGEVRACCERSRTGTKGPRYMLSVPRALLRRQKKTICKKALCPLCKRANLYYNETDISQYLGKGTV